MIVRLTPEAEADILRLVGWLAERSPAAARKATVQLLDSLALLGAFPYLGRPVGPVIREKVVHFGRDGFVVTYEVRPTEILVREVFHGRQDR